MGTVTAGVELRTAPLEVHSTGKASRLSVPGEVEAAFGPIRNPVTGAEHRASVLLPTGMLTKREDFFSADVFSVRAGALTFAHPGRNALAFRATWRAPSSGRPGTSPA